jgi:hypothetical protein
MESKFMNNNKLQLTHVTKQSKKNIPQALYWSLLVALTFCFSTSVNAQVSTFIEKGKSAVSLQGGISSMNNFMYTGSLGASLKGKFDFELTSNYGTLFYNYDEINSKESNQVYLSGIATWWFLRKQIIPDLEINLGLKGGYEHCKYNQFSYIIQDTVRIDYMNYYAAKIGFSSSMNVKLTDKWFFQPFYTIYFDCGQDTYYRDNELNRFFNYGESSYLGFSLFNRSSNGNVFHVTFNEYLSTYSTLTNYSLMVGYVIVL